MHTPTPWIYVENEQSTIGDIRVQVWSSDHGVAVADCGSIHPDDHSQQLITARRNDAALIVRAVNAHEAMNNALERIVDDYTHGTWCPDSDELIPTIRRALALADGKG